MRRVTTLSHLAHQSHDQAAVLLVVVRRSATWGVVPICWALLHLCEQADGLDTCSVCQGGVDRGRSPVWGVGFTVRRKASRRSGSDSLILTSPRSRRRSCGTEKADRAAVIRSPGGPGDPA